VSGRRDRDRAVDRVDADVSLAEVEDIRQLLMDGRGVDPARVARFGQVAVDGPGRHVQVHVRLAVDAAPGLHLQVDRPADHVAAGQVFDRRRVTLHEALAPAVEQDAAFAAHALGDQHAQPVEAGRVKLEELHILQRQAAPQQDGGAVAGQAVGVAGDRPDPPPAAGGPDHGLAAEDVQLARADLDGDHARRPPVVAEELIHNVVLVKEGDLVLDALLVEGLQNHVPGAVGGVAGAAHRLFGLVVGVAAKAALADRAVRVAVEGQAQMLQLDHGADGFLGQHAHRVLVGEVVAALDRVEGVPLPVILFHVAQRRADAALGRPGMAAGGVELADDRHLPAGEVLAGVERGRQPRAPRADNHNVEFVCVHSFQLSANRDFTCPARR